MSVLDWLDPTRSWPVVAGPAPELNRMLLQFDALRFGAPVEAARFLGKPDQFHWHNRIHKDCELLYAAKGLRLRFRQDRLRDVRFLIGAGSCDHPAFRAAHPMAPDGTRLTPQITRETIEGIFGAPDPQGSDETCLQIFHRNGIASDFNLDEQGQLIEWALYPDD
jgi:hypothetical protein